MAQRSKGDASNPWSKAAGRTASLSLLEQKFVAAYIGEANGNATEAAVIAGYPGKRESIARNVRRLLERPLIADAIADAREAMAKDGIMSAEERQRTLTTIARNPAVEPRDRIKAIEVLCRIHGDYAAEKIDANLTGLAVVVRFPRRAK